MCDVVTDHNEDQKHETKNQQAEAGSTLDHSEDQKVHESNDQNTGAGCTLDQNSGLVSSRMS
jgi:hypothetical protein